MKTIIAIDEANNTYEKQVSLDVIEDTVCIIIGKSIWSLDDILKPIPKNHGDKFHIDISGRHHNGYSVWCSRKELTKLITGVNRD